MKAKKQRPSRSRSPSPSPAMSPPQAAQRAKVYKLTDEGNWVDKGTGHVSFEYSELAEAASLVVISEEDNSKLLVHKISKEDVYHRTDDSIISWRGPEAAADLALSFEENLCCSLIWDQIYEFRKSIHFISEGDSVRDELLDLPTVNISSLEKILKILTDASLSFLERDQVASLMAKDPSFLCKLCELFTTCEDIGAIESLHMLSNIAKLIISLNDSYIFEIIFDDDLIMNIIGMLEYDPDVILRQNHRNYLKEHSIFKEVVPISNPSILAKIHQNYRLTYIKDVILPNVLDNLTFASINAMILNNNLIVMQALVDDTIFIKKLFEELKSSKIPIQEKADLVRLLQEFCSLSKTLQLPIRVKLFSSCVEEGLFDVVTELLASKDENMQLWGAEILIVILNNYESSALQNFLMHQPGQTLLSLLVTGIVASGPEVPLQLLEVLKMLLDCDAADMVPPEKSPFLEVFYGNYMNQIVEVLSSSMSFTKEENPHDANLSESSVASNSEVLGNICELLSFCVQHHTFRIKYYMLVKNKVMEKVLKLTQRREKCLVVAAVRFFKICIGRKDEFYYRYIAKNDLFGPVVEAFLANGCRYNLLDSAVLDLFNTILVDNSKTLLVYVVEKYYEKLKHIHYVDIFEKMKIKYVQVTGVTTTERLSGGVHDKYTRKNKRDLSKDEEKRIKKASDDNNDCRGQQRTALNTKPAQALILNSRSSRGTFALVDYEDDDPSNNNEEAAVCTGNESVVADKEANQSIESKNKNPTLSISDSMLKQQENKEDTARIPESLKPSSSLQEEDN